MGEQWVEAVSDGRYPTTGAVAAGERFRLPRPLATLARARGAVVFLRPTEHDGARFRDALAAVRKAGHAEGAKHGELERNRQQLAAAEAKVEELESIHGDELDTAPLELAVARTERDYAAAAVADAGDELAELTTRRKELAAEREEAEAQLVAGLGPLEPREPRHAPTPKKTRTAKAGASRSRASRRTAKPEATPEPMPEPQLELGGDDTAPSAPEAAATPEPGE